MRGEGFCIDVSLPYLHPPIQSPIVTQFFPSVLLWAFTVTMPLDCLPLPSLKPTGPGELGALPLSFPLAPASSPTPLSPPALCSSFLSHLGMELDAGWLDAQNHPKKVTDTFVFGKRGLVFTFRDAEVPETKLLLRLLPHLPGWQVWCSWSWDQRCARNARRGQRMGVRTGTWLKMLRGCYGLVAEVEPMPSI